MPPRRSRRLLPSVLIGLFLVIGCGPRVTRANYDEIEVGMPISEVVDLLGEPDETEAAGFDGLGVDVSGGKHVWRDGERSIEVIFLKDEVKLKSARGL